MIIYINQHLSNMKMLSNTEAELKKALFKSWVSPVRYDQTVQFHQIYFKPSSTDLRSH